MKGNNILDESSLKGDDNVNHAAGAAIDELICGYAAEHRKQKVLVVLEAFIDDSEAHIDAQVLVLAGYVGFANQWSTFSDEWLAALHATPGIDHFHMVDAWSFTGEFAGWNAPDRDAKVLSLARVIRKHKLRSISVEVSRRDFREVYEPFAPYEASNPYFPCFHGLCVTLARWHESMGLTVPVDFIFDEKGSIGLDAAMWYGFMKNNQLPAISQLMGGPPIFRDDKKVLPLQAADLLAWHLRRKKEHRYSAEHHPALNLAMSEHCETGFDRDELASMGCRMAKMPGVEFTRDKKRALARKPDAEGW